MSSVSTGVGLAFVVMTSTACRGEAPRTADPAAHEASGGSFFDGFDRFDAARWYVSDGWVNGGHQGCTWSRDNVSISGGRLQLRLGKAVDKLRPYRCAEIRTLARHGYGTYEARMWTAAGSGVNSAMFTYSGLPQSPVHDEIDFEFLGKAPTTVQLNYFVSSQGGHESLPGLKFDASAGCHDYAFVWLPGRIDWYVDAHLVRSETSRPLPATTGQFFLSLWNGSSELDGWLGHFDASKTPLAAEIDWIGFTKVGDKCRFPQSITCRITVDPQIANRTPKPRLTAR